MQSIEGILFEPVGCLAEFPSDPFIDIATRCFGRRHRPSRSGSRSYWHLLNLMEAADRKRHEAEDLELEAVEQASCYDDVVPALTELKAMGTKLVVASSLCSPALTRFLDKFRLAELFSGVWSRDNAGGIKGLPLRRAMESAALQPRQSMFLTDTAEGLNVAQSLGLNAILMMNDPDDAMRLTRREPAGGIVSLHELPDFLRLVAAENSNRSSGL